jgi:hypothetical protein
MEFKTEKQFTEYLLPLLKQHNEIQKEVFEKTNKFKIDLLLNPKHHAGISIGKIGIELKNPNKKVDYINALLQTYNYSLHNFNKYPNENKTIAFFTYNPFNYENYHEEKLFQLYNKIIGLFGLGTWYFNKGKFELYAQEKLLYCTNKGYYEVPLDFHNRYFHHHSNKILDIHKSHIYRSIFCSESINTYSGKFY